jgi:hypothetical protein
MEDLIALAWKAGIASGVLMLVVLAGQRAGPLLASIAMTYPFNSGVGFALLMWERAKMIGFDGDREAEIGQHERAAGLLEDLLDTPYGAGRSEQIRRALGYVLGDLGHAAQLADRPERSRTAFERAAEVWGDLNRERPENEEYAEALAWNLQRLEAVR